MTTYVISYDLNHQPPSIYNELIRTLEQMGARHAQRSLWAVESQSSPNEIYDQLRPHLHHHLDHLVVIEGTIESAVMTVDSPSWCAFQDVFRSAVSTAQDVQSSISDARFRNMEFLRKPR
jgi:hypothetical protein